MLLLGNCKPFVMCYNVQVCIVKRPGSEQLKTLAQMRRHVQMRKNSHLISVQLKGLIKAHLPLSPLTAHWRFLLLLFCCCFFYIFSAPLPHSYLCTVCAARPTGSE